MASKIGDIFEVEASIISCGMNVGLPGEVV